MKYATIVGAGGEKPLNVTVNSNGQINGIESPEQKTFPTRPAEGQFDTTFAFDTTSYDTWPDEIALANSAEHLIIPETFTNFTGGLGAQRPSGIFSSQGCPTKMKKLTILGSGQMQFTCIHLHRNLATIDLPNALSVNMQYISQSVSSQVSKTLTVNAPKATTYSSGSLGSVSSLKFIVNLDAEFEAKESTFSPASNATDSEYHLNGVKVVNQTGSGQWLSPGKYYFPAINEFNKSSAAYAVNVYFGSELTRVNSSGVTYLKDSRVTVHIPAGDTATKTTLDALGVSYTQDYIPE